ncbi:dTMP kinase [Pontixanthobacter aestiaquae]|uniref:Thymidylate kinase n=1 Tax=Pontixanthobacter aestiaquae TaxID=1509367 RepID=A0A844Z4J6_9SPHN|nr:dTMP kinase [Pontixanthobacter aestiaquae]MDN3645399.1 dTMP kinase [Pontixanthobacter aestiaquae]MXO83601.1 dTMP kinase [Pontixanthobacter aestiaquae]
MMAGKFIAFEGGEGTGKSTQARLLTEYLQSKGISTVLTREPGGTAGAEAIRSLLLDPPGEGWGARAEALLFAAARSDHVEKLIRPGIAADKWVICDRFLDSSRAYQGGAGGVGDNAVLSLHEVGSDGLRPDLTILISVPPATIAARLAERDGDTSDAIGGRSAEYHAEVASTFLNLAKSEPDRFFEIDGDGTAKDVHQRVLAVLEPLLGAQT